MRQPVPAEDCPAGRELPDPKQWLDLYGDALYRYALSRLRRPHDAEEVVQETLLAALQARSEFQGRSHPQSWLLGILRNKLHSRLRAEARARPVADADDLDVFFNERDKWRKPPRSWGDPAHLAERNDFWRVVRHCLSGLPRRTAVAFTLRTLDDLSAADVCRQLDVSPENFWVMLHRARLGLVRCLQQNWFGNEDKKC